MREDCVTAVYTMEDRSIGESKEARDGFRMNLG